MTRLRINAKPGFTLAILTMLPAAAFTQDAHYWSHQYGTRANLLGGAVIGSVVDISAVFYNPGAVALIDDPDVLATSKTIQLIDVNISDPTGTLPNLDDLRFDIAPGFFGGQIPFRFLGSNRLGYSLFTRNEFKSRFDDTATTGPDAVLSGIVGKVGTYQVGKPGSRVFSGEALCVSYAITGRVGDTISYQARFRKDGATTVGV